MILLYFYFVIIKYGRQEKNEKFLKIIIHYVEHPLIIFVIKIKLKGVALLRE